MATTMETEPGWGSVEAYEQSMGKFREGMGKYRAHESKMMRRAEARQDAKLAMMRREQKRKSSVWSNLGLVATQICSAFGPWGALIGGLAGAGIGMGVAAARGGDPFDMGAQFEYMDPGLLMQAGSSVAGSMVATKARNDAAAQGLAERDAARRAAGYGPGSIQVPGDSVPVSSKMKERLQGAGLLPRGYR